MGGCRPPRKKSRHMDKKVNERSLSSDRMKVIIRTLRLALRSVRATQGAFLLRDDGTERLCFKAVVSRSGLSGYENVFCGLIGQRVQFGDGITGQAAATGRAQIGKRSKNADSFYTVSGDGTPESVMAIPILSPDTVLGVITAVSFDPDREFGFADADLMCEYADVVSEVIQL